MESPEPGPPHGPWQLGNDAGYGCCYEHSARGTAGEDGARGPEHLPPLRPALSSSSSEGEPAAARRREPSLSDEAGGGYEFDSAESGTSLRYSTGGEGSEGAGLASSESGGSGFSLAASALPERKRPRSADGGGGRPRYEVVRELGPEEVRWLYREDRKSWKPFIGYDSLRLELAYRALGPGAGPGPPVCVRGGLYEVDVSSAECYPVYWQQTDKIPVMRGQWFIDGTWQPLEEEESNLIEQEHLSCFKGQQMQENFDMEVSKPVDGKEEHFHCRFDKTQRKCLCEISKDSYSIDRRFKNLKCLPKSERDLVWSIISEVLKEQQSNAETTEPKPPKKKKINLLLVASDSDAENEHASVCMLWIVIEQNP